MARNTRRAGKGIFGRVYSPLYHLLEASRNVGKSAFKRSGKIVDSGLGFVQNTGKSVAKHANMAVRNVTSRRNRTERRDRRNRKERSRRNRSERNRR